MCVCVSVCVDDKVKRCVCVWMTRSRERESVCVVDDEFKRSGHPEREQRDTLKAAITASQRTERTETHREPFCQIVHISSLLSHSSSFFTAIYRVC